ncbi:MAG: hypothetical protein AABW81_02650 [Nanoarchaeota archaeon]
MIKNIQPVSMAESFEYIKKDETSEIDLNRFIRKFVKISHTDAKKLRKKFEELDIIKINAEGISKIIDLMPESVEDLNKIFSDVGLDEDESKKILETIKEFK